MLMLNIGTLPATAFPSPHCIHKYSDVILKHISMPNINILST
jgi:hypothetical protein